MSSQDTISPYFNLTRVYIDGGIIKERRCVVVQIFGKNGILAKISRRMSQAGEDTGDTAEVSLAPMTLEMITPSDKPVSRSRAIQVYKKYMLDVGYLEKSDVSDFVFSLKEAMAEREEELKFEIKSAKEQVAEARAEVKSVKKQRAKAKDDDDLQYLQEELDSATAELAEETANYDTLTADLELFKKDKREFLLNYINSEIHGDDWQEK